MQVLGSKLSRVINTHTFSQHWLVILQSKTCLIWVLNAKILSYMSDTPAQPNRPWRGEFNSKNKRGFGPVFDVRAALGLSRTALATEIGGNARTIQGAEHRGGAIAGIPALKLLKLAVALPDSQKTPAILEFIATQKRQMEATQAALADD